jgi:uncharacterized membrane protein YeiH
MVCVKNLEGDKRRAQAGSSARFGPGRKKIWISLASFSSLSPWVFGGGVIRDLLLGSLPPASFENPWYITVVGVAAVVGSLFLWTLDRLGGLLFVADALTIGLFAVVGTNKAILFHLGILPAVLIGILAAVGGSILADVLMGETPSTMVAGPPNAVAAALGAVTYYGCYVSATLGNLDSTLCAVAVTFSLRFLGMHFGVQIPKPLRRR